MPFVHGRTNFCDPILELSFGEIPNNTPTGHLDQGGFKAFPIEEDDHLDAVLRYVERNPVRGNQPQTESELTAIRQSVRRGTPFGGDSWVTQSAARLKIGHTLRPRGRPKSKGTRH
jgi:putative transposase